MLLSMPFSRVSESVLQTPRSLPKRVQSSGMSKRSQTLALADSALLWRTQPRASLPLQTSQEKRRTSRLRVRSPEPVGQSSRRMQRASGVPGCIQMVCYNTESEDSKCSDQEIRPGRSDFPLENKLYADQREEKRFGRVLRAYEE